MQLSEPIYEVTAEQVVARDIAECYIRIQQNTQFLTNIVRHQQGRAYPPFHIDILNIDLKSFFNLIVQSSYLLYTCSIRKASIFFSKNLFVAYQKDGSVQILVEFLLEQEWINFDEHRKKDIQNRFNYINPYKYQNAYAESVVASIENYLKIISEYSERQKDKKVNFDRNHIRQLSTLNNAVKLLQSALQKVFKPKAFISCLQETQIFRTYSYLLKSLNCSLYETLRKTGRFEQIIQQIKRKQLIISERLNFMIQQEALQYEVLQNCVEDFIKYLASMNLIEVQIPTNTNSNDAAKERGQTRLGTSQVYKHGDRVYSWKIMVEQKRMREFNEKILNELAEGDNSTVLSQDNRKHYNLFQVEYMAKRNLISVWYVSNIEINIENSDSLIYHCNNMMIQLNNMSVQQTERQSTKANKRKDRVLAFKVITSFNFKQNPLINFLLLIDKAMICGKVCEPQIAKKTGRVEDFSRFNVVSKRINHLSNLFIKKVRRLYENISIKNKET